MNIDFNKIIKLKKELNQLLEDRPELKDLQNKINTTLLKTDRKNRLAIAQSLMFEKFHELNKKLTELVKNTKGFKK